LESADTSLDLQKAVSDFNETAFFECHEVLEELWRPMSPEQPLRTFMQGWIQVAVGFHHWQQNNAVGACNLLQAGLSKLKDNLASLPGDWELKMYKWSVLIHETETQWLTLQTFRKENPNSASILPPCQFPKLKASIQE